MTAAGAFVAIHQPEYFPWLGFLDKARQVDVLVLLDTVQFDRSSLQHRAKVAGPNGPVWLTIPFVHEFPQTIHGLRFADPRWATKHLKSLQASYGRAAGYAHARERLAAFYAEPRDMVADATVASVSLLLDVFKVTPPRVVRASELTATGEKAELVLAICRELGANRYLSGRTGATYLDAARFAEAGIDIVVQQYRVPEYRHARALSEEDARGLSALDAWLSLGDKAPDLFERGERR